MSKVSWKEVEQAFEDEKPIEEQSTTWEETRDYNEWLNRKREEEEEERFRNEHPSWDYDFDFMYDWDYDTWYGE